MTLSVAVKIGDVRCGDSHKTENDGSDDHDEEEEEIIQSVKINEF